MSTINERFARLGELEADQVRKLYWDITSVLVDLEVELFDKRGSFLFERDREQLPTRMAYSSMADLVKREAVRRGMMWLERCTTTKLNEIVPIVPMEEIVARVKALEGTVDKLMREVACGR